MFLDRDEFPFLNSLEENWHLVRAELDNLEENEFFDWPEKNLHGKGWNIFAFHAFGQRIDAACMRCPQTACLLEKVPGLVTAGYSLLHPGTHIRPHVGLTKAVIRSHLGLRIPKDCAIRVGHETRVWQEGRTLVFDDTTEHESWNHSNLSRVVLLIDFKSSQDDSEIIRPKLLSDQILETFELGISRGKPAKEN